MKGEHLFKHGMSRSPEHRAWCKMIERCTNPNAINFERYGGRGVKVCDEWRNSFEQFFQSVGPRPTPQHSIERKNNSLGYRPGNCKWATRLEQANNKRNNVMVEYLGETKSVAEWCRLLGLDYNIVRQRIYRNKWTPARAFST